VGACDRAHRLLAFREKRTMPICYVEAPPGISSDAKKRMMEKITEAIDEGYNKIDDTFVSLREDNSRIRIVPIFIDRGRFSERC
jgi:hypothetical protein